jgi:phosphoribosylaminoimidazole synthetase
MSVNDLIVQGAKPIFFLDYIATNKIELLKFKKILNGITKGCKISGCSLIGGETAEMPKTYEKNKFDLAGFAVGLVEKKNLLTKDKVKENDIILAIPSSGLHSNGYSLINHILKKKKNYYLSKKIKKELIKPTKIYVNELNKINEKKLINGCANITGGGLLDNLIRVIPEKLSININLSKIKTKPIFSWLKKSNIKDWEMLKTFNCGVGFCLIANKKNIIKIKKIFTNEYMPYEIGFVSKEKKRINTLGKIIWEKK